MLGQGIIGKGGAVYGLLPDGQDAQQILRDTGEKCSLPLYIPLMVTMPHTLKVYKHRAFGEVDST